MPLLRRRPGDVARRPLAVDELNANGGVGGQTVQQVKDDVSDLSPENFVQPAQRLTGLEKVAASFGGYCSNNSVEFRTYADSGMPMFHFNTLQANVDYVRQHKMENIYHSCPTEIWYGRGFVPLMQGRIDSGQWTPSSKTAAVITGNDPDSISIANALATDVKKICWKVPLFEQVTAPTADWGPCALEDPGEPAGADLRDRLHRLRSGQFRQAVRHRAHAVAALPAVRTESRSTCSSSATRAMT